MSRRDDSTPVDLPSDASLDVAELPAPGTSTLAVMPGTTREIHGQVTGIKSGLLDQPSYLELKDRSGAPRRIAFRIPPGYVLGVMVGDQVTAKVRLEVVGKRPATDGLLLDGRGHLLLAASGSGDDDFAPGFRLERDGASNALVFSRAGATAVVQQGDWRRLSTKDGEFLLTSSPPRSMAIPGLDTAGAFPYCILRIT